MPPGSGINDRLLPFSTSVVPRTLFQLPADVAPDASCDAQLSVIPAMMGVSSGMPVCAAADADTRPTSAPGLTSCGKRLGATPSESISPVSQSPAIVSQPDFSALLRSAALGPPPRQPVTKSDCGPKEAPRPISPSASHIHFGKP